MRFCSDNSPTVEPNYLKHQAAPPNKTAIMKMNSGSEGQARNLKNHIAELESRLAHPQHWTEGENKQNAEKLRQLIFERQRLISIQHDDLSDFN
jgi:hypothetical protein